MAYMDCIYLLDPEDAESWDNREVRSMLPMSSALNPNAVCEGEECP